MPDPSPAERSDADLVIAIRGGEEAALAELYRRYAQPLYAAAYRVTGSRADAEDAVHDVFVGLERALGSYDEQGKVLAWLRTVTIRTALMGVRTRRRRRERHEGLERPTSSDPEPVEERIAVRDALDRMSEKLRLVFMLKEMEGFSHREIADQLGISEGASSVRLSRAWSFLRRTLGGQS